MIDQILVKQHRSSLSIQFKRGDARIAIDGRKSRIIGPIKQDRSHQHLEVGVHHTGDLLARAMKGPTQTIDNSPSSLQRLLVALSRLTLPPTAGMDFVHQFHLRKSFQDFDGIHSRSAAKVTGLPTGIATTSLVQINPNLRPQSGDSMNRCRRLQSPEKRTDQERVQRSLRCPVTEPFRLFATDRSQGGIFDPLILGKRVVGRLAMTNQMDSHGHSLHKNPAGRAILYRSAISGKLALTGCSPASIVACLHIARTQPPLPSAGAAAGVSALGGSA